jgi:hypothetical protein
MSGWDEQLFNLVEVMVLFKDVMEDDLHQWDAHLRAPLPFQRERVRNGSMAEYWRAPL